MRATRFTIWAYVEVELDGGEGHADLAGPEPIGRYDTLAEVMEALRGLSTDPEHCDSVHSAGEALAFALAEGGTE